MDYEPFLIIEVISVFEKVRKLSNGKLLMAKKWNWTLNSNVGANAVECLVIIV